MSHCQALSGMVVQMVSRSSGPQVSVSVIFFNYLQIFLQSRVKKHYFLLPSEKSLGGINFINYIGSFSFLFQVLEAVGPVILLSTDTRKLRNEGFLSPYHPRYPDILTNSAHPMVCNNAVTSDDFDIGQIFYLLNRAPIFSIAISKSVVSGLPY